MISGHGHEQKFKYSYTRDSNIIQMPYPRAKAIDYQLWQRPLKMASTVYETEISIASGTHAYMLRGYSRMSRRRNGVHNSRNRLCFCMAHNSSPLWLLEFCLSIFVVSCSSLSEDSAEFRYVSLYIADQVELCCSFYKDFTLLYSKFTNLYEED